MTLQSATQKMTIEHPLLSKFDKDFRAYIEASVRFAELQEPYQALDFEVEMRWIKEWLRENAYAKDSVMKEFIESFKEPPL